MPLDFPTTTSGSPYDLPLTSARIQEIYESGFQGVLPDTFASTVMAPFAAKGFYEVYPFALDIGKGKVLTPYRAALAIEPEFGKYEAQTTGDCVSHGTRNAGAIDWSLDVLFGRSRLLQAGDVIKDTNGDEWSVDNPQPRLATENIYGARGHGGQGANCGTLTYYASADGKGGYIQRAKYTRKRDNYTIDLSKYKSSIGHNWGRSGTPSAVNSLGRISPALRRFKCESLQMARDAIFLGFGICRCSGLGFSSTRDENGFSPRRGSWAHSESWIGFDDSDWVKGSKYVTDSTVGVPCEQNSWGSWNGGKKQHEQPTGSYWMYQKDARSMLGSCYIMASIAGHDIEYARARAEALAGDYVERAPTSIAIKTPAPKRKKRKAKK